MKWLKHADRWLFFVGLAAILISLVAIGYSRGWLWLNSMGMEDEGIHPADASMRAIAGTMAQYKNVHGDYPRGNAQEIAAVLLGRTAERKAFLHWPKKKISGDGELLDTWGTPYQFKFDGDRVEVRSPGPDRVVGNEDDWVSR